MKTKRFRLLTVLLTVVMLVALSLNVMAAKSNAVTQDGLTAQLITDKDSYKASESVKASVQVDNHTGREVFIFTQINVPESIKLSSESAAFDARLQDGETWTTPGGVTVSAGSAAAGAAATGDNMQAGFYIILTALAVGGIFALLVYGKNRRTWLSVLLCMAMVAGMAVAAVPAQAAEMNGDIQLSCAIQVDGKDTELTATVSYVIYDEAEDATNESIVAPTEAPTSAPTEAPTEEPTPTPTVAPTEAPVAAVDKIYVSASAEAGEGDGTIGNPFANIEEAKALVREIKAAGKYPETGITVYFREGVYPINETILFEEADSGEEGAPVVYSAYNNEKVQFNGGFDIELSKFTAVTDQTILGRLVDADAASHIKQVNLLDLGLTLDDLGQMNVFGHSLGYINTAGIEVPKAQPPELFFNDQEMTIARYPNEGTWATVVSAEEHDAIMSWTPASADAPEDAKDNPICPTFTFTVKGDDVKTRMARWSNAEDLWVYGYWQVYYSEQSMSVAELNVETGAVTTKTPSGRTVTPGQTFYFYNLLEELDTPGEYYIDRDSGVMYFYPPEESGTATLSLLDDFMVNIATGTHDIDFVGIEFKAGRSDAINMKEVERVKVTDCDVSGFASFGMHIRDCKDIKITGCHLYDLGTGGVIVSYNAGSKFYNDVVYELKDMGILVENCEINNFSRIAKTYSPAVRTEGVGMIVRNCKIYDAPHYAILMRGNDILIENNEIFDVLQECADSGVIYDGYRKEQMGVVIRNNYIHDISSSRGTNIYAVYCDDTKDGVTVESNLIVNFKGSGVFINGGWDNTVKNNVFVNVSSVATITANAMSSDDRYKIATHSNYALFRQLYNEGTEAYQKYPHWDGKLEELLENNAPMYNVIENNVRVNVDNDTNCVVHAVVPWSVENILRDNTINDSYVYDLDDVGFADIENGAYTLNDEEFVLVNTGDFTIKEDSVLFTDIAGFEAYDLSKIGLIDEETGKASVEKPSGPIGPLAVEERDPNVLYANDFTSGKLEGWNGNILAEGSSNYAVVNSDKWLEFGMSVAGNAWTGTSLWEGYDGSVSYEFDFKADLTNYADMDPNILIAKSGTLSLVNVKIFRDNSSGNWKFGTYDKAGAQKVGPECVSGETYHIKLVVNPKTDKYDLYVGEEKVISQGNLRYDAGTLDSVQITANKTSAGDEPILYFDNLLVKKCEDPLPEGYLLVEEFSDTELTDWTYGSISSNSYVKVNDAKQLEISMTGSDKVDMDTSFDKYTGIVSYELDYTVNRDGSKVVDPGVLIVRGEGKSLVNIKIYSDDENGNVFGAYDGSGENRAGKEHPTTTACENGETYHIKTIVYPESDTYDLYVDGVLIISGSPLRYTTDSVDGVRISVNGKGTTEQPIAYYDNLTVKKVEAVNATGVTLNKETLELAAGSDATLTATIVPDNATNKAVTWTSSATDVAIVDENGKVTAVAPGTATITATTANNKTATCAVTVTSSDVLLSEDFSAADALSSWGTGSGGCTDCCYAKVVDGKLELCLKDKTWATGTKTFSAVADKVAIEFDLGVEYPDGCTDFQAKAIVKSGTSNVATIQVAYNTTDGKYYLQTYDGSPSVKIAECKSGDTFKIKVVADPSVDTYDLYIDGEIKSSGRNFLNKVDSIDTIYFTIARTDTTSGNTTKANYDNILVQKAVDATGVSINEGVESVTIEEDKTVQLTATVTPDNATDKTVTWTSSATDVATVDANGVVTGVKAGTATITATVGTDIIDTITVTVTETAANVAVTGVTLNKATLELAVAEGKTLTATVAPDNATDKTVTWTSSDDTVAAVANGVVTGVKAGTATITAKAGEETATCTVKVYTSKTSILTDAFGRTNLKTEDDNTTPTGWGGNDTATINTDGWLQLLGSTENTTVGVWRSFGSYTGKVYLEFDYKIAFGESKSADPNVIVVKGGENKSLVNVKLYYHNTLGWIFGAYDGSGTLKSTQQCVDGQSYHLKLIVDRATGKYNLYVGDTEITAGGRDLLASVDDVNAILLNLKPVDVAPVSAYYDNVNVYTYAE
ncbi:MAG: Ig-like domain-containing protein [Lachnospiraceae bacterium]|nr:Ig-like domain-containing protein [Lachnospiraceae bacterium]